MKKTILIALVLAVVGFCRSTWAVEIENASSGAIVPGEWNTNFQAAKSYAEQNKIPLFLFWSNPGCAQCNKMKKACNTDTFVAWRRAKQIVMVISEGDRSSKQFAMNSSKKFPYMRLYWPAGSVDVRFTGRASSIRASGATLEAQLINYLDSLLTNWTPGTKYEGGGNSTESEEDLPPGDEWKRARKLYASIKDAKGNVAGRLIVTAGKLNAKKGNAKIKVQVLDLLGKMRTLGSKNFTVKGKTNVSVSGAVGKADLSIKSSDLSGSVVLNGVTYEVYRRTTGGSIADGTLFFTLNTFPTECQGNPVINGTAFLPIPQSFKSANSRWTFARKGTLRYDADKKTFVMSATDNPSDLKLTYKAQTGYFKGTFIVYTRRGEKAVKNYKATVGGYMLEGSGSGRVTIRNVGTYECSISPNQVVRD